MLRIKSELSVRIFALLNLVKRVMLIVVAENSISKLVIMFISMFLHLRALAVFKSEES